MHTMHMTDKMHTTMSGKQLIKMGLLLVAIIIIPGCGATGAKAIDVMSPQQKSHLDGKLMMIRADMTVEDVVQILGPWRRRNLDLKYYWPGPGDEADSEIEVDFWRGKAWKVRWVSPGRFVWERKL